MDPFQMMAMMPKFSDAELAQIAQRPASMDAAMLAVQELDRRKQSRSSAQQQQPQTTVLEDRVAETMPRQSSSAASDPIAAGLGAIMQQRQQPQQFAGGGLVGGGGDDVLFGGPREDYVGDLQAMIPEIERQRGGPSTPEEWIAAYQQFQGPDRLNGVEKRLMRREQALGAEHSRDRWMALAQAGLGMMGPGNFWSAVSRGGQQGLAALQQANSTHRAGISGIESARTGLDEARQRRADSASSAAFEGYTGREQENFRAGLDAAANVGRLRESARDRAARVAAENQVEVLAGQLLRANRGTMVQDGTSSGRSGRVSVPFIRPYNEQDALRDAISLASGARGRRSPDDLSEITSSARAIVADPMSPPELRARAQDILTRVMSGELGNAGTSTGAGSGIASGASAPLERTRAPSEPSSSLQGQIQNYQRQRPQPDPRLTYNLNQNGEIAGE